jgi:hypothetical protein
MNQTKKERGKQEREEHKHDIDSQKHLTNRIPKDTRRLGPPFPLQSLVLAQIHQFMDLSHKKT